MVADFEEGRILGELQDVEDEIKIVERLKNITKPDDNNIKLSAVLRLLDKLVHQQDRLIVKLQHHRQKVKESGIKY